MWPGNQDRAVKAPMVLRRSRRVPFGVMHPMTIAGLNDQQRATWIRRVPGLRIDGWRLGALLGLTVGVAVALSAIGGLLITMHPPSLAGWGLAQGFDTNGLGGGVEAATSTFNAWRTFDALGYSADLPSAFTIAALWLVLDIAFIALYASSVLALATNDGPLSGQGTANTLATTRALALALALTDLVENSLALSAVSTQSASAALVSALFVARVIKVFLLTIPLLALLMLLGLRRLRVLWSEPRVRQGLVMARPQIIVVLLIAAALWYEPASDVLLDIGTTQTVAMLIFGGLLSAGLGIGSRVLIDRDRVAYGPVTGLLKVTGLRFSPEDGRPVGALLALLLALALAVLAAITGWSGLRGAALVVLSVLAASWALQDSEELPPERQGEHSTARLPVLLALAPAGLLGVALVHWTLWADIVLNKVPTKAIAGLALAALASALVAPIGKVVETAQRNSEVRRPQRIHRLVGDLARSHGKYNAATWAIIVIVMSMPVALLLLSTRFVDVRYFGPMSLLFGAGATLNLVGSWLVIATDWWRDEFGMPSVFEALRMRRIPVFLLLLLWLVINTVAFADPAYYDVVTSGTNQRVALEDAYDDWKSANLPEGAEVVPLVVVAAEGGGLRAAYWTERVLTELFSDGRLQPFVLSGTSGGSVGIASYVARQEPLGDATQAGGVGLADVPDPDFLSAVFQRWFTVDLAHSLLRHRPDVGDRAAALADALGAEIPQLQAPYDYVASEGSFQPITIFNATDLQDGCLAPISTLSNLAGAAVTTDDLGCLDPDRRASEAAGFPGAADIAHDCPGRGMSFATAAITSARSPYVLPAGRLESCGEGVFYLGDGGYVDNSGAVAAGVVLERISDLVAADNAEGNVCIVPIMLQIDNGAETLLPGGQAKGNPSQILVVPTGALAANSARHDVAKVAAAALVQQPLTDANGRIIDVNTNGDPEGGPQSVDRYYRIFPLAQAGRDATVGWMLSQPSKDALETQLGAAISDAAALLSPAARLSCD